MQLFAKIPQYKEDFFMGNCYKHLSVENRKEIYELWIKGYAISEIASMIGFHKTTIYRELNRNSSVLGYQPDKAEQTCQQRKLIKPTKLDKQPELKSEVINYLENGWSPELISGFLQKRKGHQVISHETIYRFIYSLQGKQLN